MENGKLSLTGETSAVCADFVRFEAYEKSSCKIGQYLQTKDRLDWCLLYHSHKGLNTGNVYSFIQIGEQRQSLEKGVCPRNRVTVPDRGGLL